MKSKQLERRPLVDYLCTKDLVRSLEVAERELSTRSQQPKNAEYDLWVAVRADLLAVLKARQLELF